MHHRTDERLALDLEQGVMLWCLRLWVAGLGDQEDAPERIAAMADQFGAPEAVNYIDGFMFALSHGAIRKIGIACVSCPRISEDERRLLDVMGLAQDGRPLEALTLLRGMVTPEAAQAALRSAEGLGAELALAGRYLQAPEAAVSHYALAPWPLDASRPPGTVLH